MRSCVDKIQFCPVTARKLHRQAITHSAFRIDSLIIFPILTRPGRRRITITLTSTSGAAAQVYVTKFRHQTIHPTVFFRRHLSRFTLVADIANVRAFVLGNVGEESSTAERLVIRFQGQGRSV